MAESSAQDYLWFWTLLESSGRSLQALCRKLEQLPKEQIRRYQLEYDKRKGYVNPHAWEECHPHLTEDWSEDAADDFAAWVVMQGLDFYEEVAADPDRIDDYIKMYWRSEVERRVGPGGRWDTEVDRPEYRGYQRPDYIATPIYKMRFDEELHEACHDSRRWPREEM